MRAIYSGAGKAAQGAKADRGVDGELLHVERAELTRLTGERIGAAPRASRGASGFTEIGAPIRVAEVAKELAG